MATKTNARRHGFRFEFAPEHVITRYARVRSAKTPVQVKLAASHVREALRLRGMGDLRNCAGAVCVRKNGNEFPHSVVGYTDFSDTRVWVELASSLIRFLEL
jgi:hypothetical protein